jgi:hypothetical protein
MTAVSRVACWMTASEIRRGRSCTGAGVCPATHHFTTAPHWPSFYIIMPTALRPSSETRPLAGLSVSNLWQVSCVSLCTYSCYSLTCCCNRFTEMQVRVLCSTVRQFEMKTMSCFVLAAECCPAH